MSDRLQVHGDFVLMWFVVLILAGVLRDAREADFERFLGGISPIVAVGVAGAAGAGALEILASTGWVGSDATRRGLARSTAIALGLGVAIILADSALGFGEGINVSWPTSILFYPVMAFLAEVTFHLVPLALVVTAAERWKLRPVHAAMVPVAAVAVLETVYQVAGSATSGVSAWLLAYLALHMIVFAVAGLTTLRTYGFGSMLWLRLVYYTIWHVAWGALRLDLLF